MTNWKTYKFSHIADLQKVSHNPSSNDDLNYIGLEHIEQETLRLNSVGNSSDVSSNKYKFGAGDILFGKLRPYFRKVYRPKFDGICSTDIWVTKAKKGFDQGFLFYLMASWKFVNMLNSGSSGTRMPRADWKFISDTEWKIPDLPTQCAIAEILSSLDDKIELNNQMNKTLEEMAQAVFQEMCSFADKMPEGWSIKQLGEIIDVKGGTTPSTKISEYWDGEIYWTSPRDLSNIRFPVLLDTIKKITKSGLKKISSGLLPKGTLLLSSRAPIGYLAISNIPVAINQGYIAILCTKDVSNYFMLFWLKQNMNKVLEKANGSTFLEISKTNFKQIEAFVPDKDTLEEFDRQAKGLFEMIVSNEIQSQKLKQTRDALLPKLLSGEIDVSEAENIIQETEVLQMAAEPITAYNKSK